MIKLDFDCQENNSIVDLYFEVSSIFLLLKSKLFHKSSKFILGLINKKIIVLLNSIISIFFPKLELFLYRNSNFELCSN